MSPICSEAAKWPPHPFSLIQSDSVFLEKTEALLEVGDTPLKGGELTPPFYL